jgi:ribosomal protein S28E/S33
MRLITDILREYRKGAPVALATSLLAEVVRAVDETGKAGEVVIKIKVKPSELGCAEKSLLVAVTSKKPVPEMQPAVFFSDTDGDLHRTDPAQREMDFQDTSRRGASN